MWTEPSSPTFLFVIAASIVAHVVSLAALPSSSPLAATAPRLATVTIETVSPPPAPTPPPPPPPPAVEPAAPERVAARAPTSRAPRPASRKPVAPPSEVAAAPPSPEPAAPVDFSGVTLSNQGSSWASPTGNGEPMTGPISAAPPSTRRGPVRASPGRPADRVVPVGNLARAPKAPDLDRALAANYPRDARRAGLTGKAVVRARILADGRVGLVRIVSESAPGFGTACKQTLAGSRWQPPLDVGQQPVMTDVSYTCTFAVTR